MAKKTNGGSAEAKAAARLLRDRRTNRYFKDDGWTESAQEARVFCDVVEAAQTCVLHGLNDVELTVQVQAGTCDLFCTSIR